MAFKNTKPRPPLKSLRPIRLVKIDRELTEQVRAKARRNSPPSGDGHRDSIEFACRAFLKAKPPRASTA